MEEALTTAAEDGVTAVVFGDLFLEDVRQYRERAMDGSGIKPVFPLWGRPNRRPGAGDDRSGHSSRSDVR